MRSVVSQPVVNRVSHTQPMYQEPMYQQPIYQEPIYQQRGYQQPEFQQSISSQPGLPKADPRGFQQQPLGSGQVARRQSTGGQPSQGPQQFTSSNPRPQRSAAPNESSLSALQMLSGADQNTTQDTGIVNVNGNSDASIPDFTPVSTTASPSQSPEYIGEWSARVGNASEVQLELDASGAFVWSASSNGKVSSFRGSFTVDNGALKLLREDNQQLVGSFQMSNSDAFSFKVANANGLQFQRR